MSSDEQSVFISYAWGDGESEKIINEIDQALQQRGIKVVRDKRDLGYKGSITEFMERLRQGNSVIAIISDKYLRSPNCMFELVEIAENKQFHNRIFPIVLPDANIYDPIKRIEYIRYWETKRAELAEAIKSLDPANLQGIREDFDLYDRIRDKISGLTSILKDMNTLTPDMLDELDQLYESIIERVAKSPQEKPTEVVDIESTADYQAQPEYVVDLIIQGPQVWNRWRQENPSIIPVISNLEMTSASLSEFDFSNVQFPNARITGSTFDEVNFSNARFLDSRITQSSFTDTTIDGATFVDTQVVKSDFSGIDLSGSKWRDTQIVESTFLATELNASRFNDVKIVDSSFEKAHLEESVFHDTEISGVSFRGSDLQRTHFHFAKLDKKVQFQEANLREIEFHDSELPNVDFSYLKMRKANFTRTSLVNSKFTNAELASAVFDQVNLENANLKRAQLKNTVFRAGTEEWGLNSADFSEADLRYARIQESSLVNANFFSANLSKATLVNNQMQHCSLRRAILQDADLRGSDLGEANLALSFMQRVKLDGCHLVKANLTGVDLGHSSLTNCNLQRADLSQSALYSVDLTDADLTAANLCRVTLIDTTVEKTKFSRCQVYGISAWNLLGVPAQQKDLVITPQDQNEITTDELEIAQFFYLLLNNAKLRNVIDTMTSKTVLILGRFTPERKVVLDALREELRKHNYIPIVFDFEAPSNRDLTETIVTLAHLSRFIIADLTDAKSIPQELKAIVPDLPSVAVQPLILKDQREYAMFEHFVRYPWVLPIYEYENQEQLLLNILDKVVEPCEKKVDEMAKKS
jgi:uncharacterized protein YjbI with pentapeptide repeats